MEPHLVCCPIQIANFNFILKLTARNRYEKQYEIKLRILQKLNQNTNSKPIFSSDVKDLLRQSCFNAQNIEVEKQIKSQKTQYSYQLDPFKKQIMPLLPFVLILVWNILIKQMLEFMSLAFKKTRHYCESQSHAF